jgi:hypothetical protein
MKGKEKKRKRKREDQKPALEWREKPSCQTDIFCQLLGPVLTLRHRILLLYITDQKVQNNSCLVLYISGRTLAENELCAN